MITLLLADAQAIMREGLRHAVQQEPDMQVVAEAMDGAAALELFKQWQPHATLLDLQLPGALAAIAAMHKLSPDAILVAMTMYPDDMRVTNALALGATFQMLKTGSSRSILAAIRDAVTARQKPGEAPGP